MHQYYLLINIFKLMMCRTFLVRINLVLILLFCLTKHIAGKNISLNRRIRYDFGILQLPQFTHICMRKQNVSGKILKTTFSLIKGLIIEKFNRSYNLLSIDVKDVSALIFKISHAKFHFLLQSWIFLSLYLCNLILQTLQSMKFVSSKRISLKY